MNTYHDNLRDTISASLQSQALEQKALRAQSDASIFTLYYAQGALVAAHDNLEAAQQTITEKAAVKKQATANSFVSNNQLSSAVLADQSVKLLISNTAICAPNVQVATAAVTRLAADIGSIYSIIKAADFETGISDLAKAANDSMNATAYEAEVASEMAMDSSAVTAQVSAPAALDQSKATNTLINNFLQLCAADLETASQIVAADNAVLETVGAAEKAAEGGAAESRTVYLAANSAYEVTNKELNLGLTTVPVVGLESTTFDVSFNLLHRDHDPVKDYYIIVVKDSEKFTFSAGDARKIIDSGVQQVSGTEIQYIQYVLVKETHEGGKYDVVQAIDIQDAAGAGVLLYDSDAEMIVPGTNYVVFVTAANDYLSSASAPFNLTRFLKPVNEKTIAVEKASEYRVIFDAVPETPGAAAEYRCMFLPCDDQAIVPQFFFNPDLAEQVPYGNYTLAKQVAGKCHAPIGPSSTDNFGNPLIKGKRYIPVILSVPGVPERYQAAYTSGLSDFNHTVPFYY